GRLTERAHHEAQRIPFPTHPLHGNHRSQGTVPAGEAILDAADHLCLAEAMAYDYGDGFAQGRMTARDNRASVLLPRCHGFSIARFADLPRAVADYTDA